MIRIFCAILLMLSLSACSEKEDPSPIAFNLDTARDAAKIYQEFKKAEAEVAELRAKMKVIEAEAVELRKLKPQLEQAQLRVEQLVNKNADLEKRLAERMTKLREMYQPSTKQ